MTVRCAPENRTRLPWEVGFKPPPPFMMPALKSSSLYLPIAAINSGSGMVPFSLSLLALTNIMHFMFISPFDLSHVVDGIEPRDNAADAPSSRERHPGFALHWQRQSRFHSTRKRVDSK